MEVAVYHGAMIHSCRSFYKKAPPLPILFLAFLGFSSPALSQNPTYLKSATLYLAVDGWADIWLNGIPIRESQPSTPVLKGFRTIPCLPEHICYFQNENILAIENSNAYNGPVPLKNQVGIAYILRLWLSNGTELTLSSNDATNNRSYYLPNRESGEPYGWRQASFADGNWSFPYVIGPIIPGVASLIDPETHQTIQFISATGASPKAQYPGERHLYRLKFHLNISPNPLCSQSKVPDADRSATLPFNTPTAQPVLPRPTSTPLPIINPTPNPVFAWRPTPRPTLTSIAISPPVWTPIFQPAPTASFTPMPVRKIAIPPTPTSIPTRVRTPLRMVRLKKPSPTPVPDFGITNRIDPIEKMAPPVMAQAAPLTPTPGVTPETTPSLAQTIVFDNQPANIYISYADGPGIYRLEVVDSSGNHLRNLFEKRVVAQQDDWVDWDGRDDTGREMPPGQYTVLYTKDGKGLNELILMRTANP
jgi:hypothetical protein